MKMVAHTRARWCHEAMSVRRCAFSILLVAMCAAFDAAHAADCSELPRPGIDWRSCDLSRSNFPGAQLIGANLRGAALSNADLSGADFSAIDGYRVRFVESVLIGASFEGAKLTDARFDRAELTGASFVGASARGVKFIFADLKGVDFTGATLRNADFTGADLTGAIWTDGMKICAEGSLGMCR